MNIKVDLKRSLDSHRGEATCTRPWDRLGDGRLLLRESTL